MAKNILDIKKFDAQILDYIDKSMAEKMNGMSSKGLTFSYDKKTRSPKIDGAKELSEDQDVKGLLFRGGIIMTKAGSENKKEGKKLVEGEDFYVVPPMGGRV